MKLPRQSGFWTVTALGRAVSAGKEAALAMVFGTTAYKDALVLAWSIPTVLAAFCSETLPALLTPVWTTGGRARGLALASAVGLALASAATLAWPGALIRVLAPTWNHAQALMAAQLVRWLAASVGLLGAQAVAAARLNAARRFAWAPAAAALPAAGALAGLAFTHGAPLGGKLVAVAAGLTAGSALGLAVMLGAILAGPRLHSRPGAAAGAAGTPRQMGALVAAMLALNLVPLAEQMAAARLPAGALASYDYGERLMLFVFGLTVAPYTAVQFTGMSEAAADAGAAFAHAVERGLRRLLTLVLPVAAVLAVYAPLLTRCTYGWGRFNAASAAATSPVVAILGAGMGLDAVFYFLLFALYARQQAGAKLPLALMLAVVNVPLTFIGAAVWGLEGVACAHVAGYAAAVGLLARRRRRWLPGVAWRRTLGPGARAGAMTLAAAAGVHACLPAPALAGSLGILRSWAWAAAALPATAAGAYLLTRCANPWLPAVARREAAA